MVRHLRQLNIFFILFFGISFFIYFLMNGGAYWRILRYNLFLHSPLAPQDLTNGNILNPAVHDAITSTDNSSSTQDMLVIGKIDVEAPIAIPKATDTKSVLASLEEGVGLYPGSSAPGVKGGRAIVLGHSSRASWYRGGYATIFALLPQLAVGDEFAVVAPHVTYTYKVFKTNILSPQDTNILLSQTVDPTRAEIDLVTCYPIGSASKRTVVQAEVISQTPR